MNNLIERYIYDVVRRLPENIRDDVNKELSANIQDMLPDSPTESDIFEVLSSLGDPAVFAEKYRLRPRYLISPALFDDYIKTLKLVSIIVGAILIFVQLISTVTQAGSGDAPIRIFTSLLVDSITGIITAASNIFMWVTVSFAIADYFCVQNYKREWTPSSLPPVPPASAVKISRSEIIAEIVFSVFFTVIFIRFPQLFGWYDVKGNFELTPLFDHEIISRFVPAFIILLILTVILAMVKLISGRWNYFVAGLNCVCKIISATFTIIFISTPGLITNAFCQKVADTFGFDIAKVTSSVEQSVRVVIFLTIVFTVVDILHSFYKAYKNHKQKAFCESTAK